MSADDLSPFGRPIHEIIHFGDSAVENGNDKAMVVHVEDKVLPHDRQVLSEPMSACAIKMSF